MIFLQNLFTFLYYIIYPNSKIIIFENTYNNNNYDIICNCNLCYTVRNITNFFSQKLKII